MSRTVDASDAAVYRSPLADADVPDLKSCSQCGQLLPRSEFCRKWTSSDRRHSECRECRRLAACLRRMKKRDSDRYRRVCRKVKALRRLKERRQVEGLSRSLLKIFGSGEELATELIHATRYAQEHGYGQSALSLVQCVMDVQSLSALALATMEGEPETVALLNDAGDMPAVLRGLISQGRLSADDVSDWAQAVRE